MRTNDLTELYQHEGPFASVTIDVSHDSETGAHEHQLRVRAACEELIEAGADDKVVQLLSERLGELVDDSSPVGRAVVACGDGIVFDQVMHARVDRPTVVWGPLPDVSAWLEHEDGTTPFVLVVVDHVGGDVGRYVSDVPDPVEESTAGGETEHVHKVPTGGWSALRYQRTVDNVWKENAEAVADEVLHHVRAGIRLVLLAGEPQSKPVVRDALESTDADVVELSTGTRAEDGGDEAFAQAIREALLEHTMARRLRLSHELRERLGQDRAVATGVDDVADAFVRGQVETLLLDRQAAAERPLDVSRHPGLALGPVVPEGSVAAHQGLVAAATVTGADVAFGRASTFGGAPVAALLRWDQPAEGTTT
jgi:Bacterial archaeo-eukaryotic release factor family 2